MDGGIHDTVLHLVEVVGEDIVCTHEVHVTHNGRWGLICVSGWQEEEVSQLIFGLFMYFPV